MTCVHRRIVVGVVDNIKSKSMKVPLSQEPSTFSFLSCGPDSPATLFSRLHPENFLEGQRYIVHNDGSARTVIALPKETTFRVQQKWKSSFIGYLKSLAAKKEDIDLVVFMLASGTEDGQVVIGSKKMGKDELEKALRRFRGKITLIIVGCDEGPWKSHRWGIVALEKPEEHTPFPLPWSANNIPLQTDILGSLWPSHSLPLDRAIKERTNDLEYLDGMNMSMRNYPCSRIDLFDPSYKTSSVHPHLRLHLTISSNLAPNPSRTHANFTSPELLSVETIDGFLATSNRLMSSAPNLYFRGFIARGAQDSQILPDAEKALRFRSTKRNQTRQFVFLMDWAVDEEDEEAGIGFSDLAMDTVAPASLCQGNISEALGSDVFLRSVSPYTHVGVHSSIRHREAGWWAARHWARAGKPTINPNHFLYTMKRAGLQPNDDALLIVRAGSPFTVCDMQLL